MEGEGDKIKSKQASKRDMTLNTTGLDFDKTDLCALCSAARPISPVGKSWGHMDTQWVNPLHRFFWPFSELFCYVLPIFYWAQRDKKAHLATTKGQLAVICGP